MADDAHRHCKSLTHLSNIWPPRLELYNSNPTLCEIQVSLSRHADLAAVFVRFDCECIDILSLAFFGLFDVCKQQLRH